MISPFSFKFESFSSFASTLLSALVSSLFMLIVLTKGIKVYQRGVLDYTNKGLKDILRKTFVIDE